MDKTMKSLRKINEKCQNGWFVDLQYFTFHHEKRLIKHIHIDPEHYIEFGLNYNSNNQITLYFNKFEHKEGEYFAHSTGLGKSKILDETKAPRKNVNKLIEFTKILNDEALMEINRNTEVTKSSIFVPTEEF